MIKIEDITKIGQLVKPHGIKGEITATIDYDIDLTELKCIIVNVDGIFVPFFINDERPKSSETVILTIDGVTDDSMAKQLCGTDYYALNSDLDFSDAPDNEGGYVSDFIGYTIVDSAGNSIGTITDYDDSTANVLFIVRRLDDVIVYIPVADEFIDAINPGSKTVTMSLPEGLIE